MTAQTHTPDDPSSENPSSAGLAGRTARFPNGAARRTNAMATGAGIRQSTAELSVDITAGMHRLLRPRRAYVWKWQAIG
jgi:hypothetical protein